MIQMANVHYELLNVKSSVHGSEIWEHLGVRVAIAEVCLLDRAEAPMLEIMMQERSVQLGHLQISDGKSFWR